jgi:hypothetical protein
MPDISHALIEGDTRAEQREFPLLNLLKYEEKESNKSSKVANQAVLREPFTTCSRRESSIQRTLGPQKKEETIFKSDLPIVEESPAARLERLGRQRPEVFVSIWAEIGFVFSISMSQILSVSIIASHILSN